MCLAYGLMGLGLLIALFGIFALDSYMAQAIGVILILAPIIFYGIKEGIENRKGIEKFGENKRQREMQDELIRKWKEDFDNQVGEHKEQRNELAQRIKPFSVETNVGTLKLVKADESRDGQIHMRLELNGEEFAHIRTTDTSEVMRVLQQTAEKNCIEIKIGDESFGYWGVMDNKPRLGENDRKY